jgi:hypothetical protein
MLLGEEKSKTTTVMDEAREIWSKENARIFPCINVDPMEEAREASLEENTKIFDGLKEGASSTTARGDEEMEEG